MEKAVEYTAVPTKDTELPPYELTPPKQQGCKKWKYVALIGGAIGLFSLFNMCSPSQPSHAQSKDLMESNMIPMPCGLSHLDQYNELNEFMLNLQDSFDISSNPCRQHKHHNHHKHHKEYHPEDSPNRDILGGPPPPPFCKIDELNATSTVFKFSTEEFQKASLIVSKYFSDGGQIHLLKNSELNNEVKVNITLYYGDEELLKSVDYSAFDHDGKYSVEVKRQPTCNRRDKKENCLVYQVDIEFPSDLESFGELDIHAAAAREVGNGKGISDIEFDSVKAGLGWGAIYFDGLKAKEIKLGVLYGVVMGDYLPINKFAGGAVRGGTEVNIEPASHSVNITASSVYGFASVEIPADKYKGQFTLYNFLGESPNVSAPNPEDIHITKYTPHLKKGYYKKNKDKSHVIVTAKKGSPKLAFV